MQAREKRALNPVNEVSAGSGATYDNVGFKRAARWLAGADSILKCEGPDVYVSQQPTVQSGA